MLKQIPLDQLKIREGRQRKEFREIKELAVSLLKTGGPIHDIVVDQDSNLIAGERRSRAIRLLATWHMCGDCFYLQEAEFRQCPECEAENLVDQEPWQEFRQRS